MLRDLGYSHANHNNLGYNSLETRIYNIYSNLYSSVNDSVNGGIGFYSNNDFTETRVITEYDKNIATLKTTKKEYDKEDKYYLPKQNKNFFNPVIFLSRIRPKTKFISASSEIISAVEKTFYLLMKQQFPDFGVFVLPEKEFIIEHQKRSKEKWHSGILGFAVHSENKIFVKEGPLDEVLLVIGHEIGHLMSAPLLDIIDEEAKAMAFSVAWAKTIKEHNIAGLKENLSFHEPAENGIHNKAQAFVNKKIREESDPLELFKDLSRKYIHFVERFI